MASSAEKIERLDVAAALRRSQPWSRLPVLLLSSCFLTSFLPSLSSGTIDGAALHLLGACPTLARQQVSVAEVPPEKSVESKLLPAEPRFDPSPSGGPPRRNSSKLFRIDDERSAPGAVALGVAPWRVETYKASPSGRSESCAGAI